LVELLAAKVPICAYIRHATQHIGKRASARTSQRCVQNLAMFLFGTAIVLCGALLQCLDQIIGQIANH
jgi:hypothetical protein